jgi:hypothetical protein
MVVAGAVGIRLGLSPPHQYKGKKEASGARLVLRDERRVDIPRQLAKVLDPLNRSPNFTRLCHLAQGHAQGFKPPISTLFFCLCPTGGHRLK